MTSPAKTFQVNLRILGEPMQIQTPQPADQVRLDETLPLIRTLDDRAIELTVLRLEATGAKVSCCKGCAACCKAQPVPVTPPEAYALLRLVEDLPEPRRSEVRARFADRVRRLREAGLASAYLERDADLTKEQARATAQKFFGLGLACPFLEDDACSIYHDRPFVCRQYLVTSPAEWCKDPFTQPVRPVPMPLTPATATLEVAGERLGTPQYTVPLVLALEYAQAHRQELERTFASREVFPQMLQAVCAKGAGEK